MSNMIRAPHWSKVPAGEWRWPNFAPAEMASKGDGSIVLSCDAMDALQRVRDRLGVPLIITSAYRDPAHNAKVGGAKRSKHMEGIAFDVRVDNVAPDALIAAARVEGFRAFGTYPRQGFVHLDTRPNAAAWGDPFPPRETAFAPEPVARPDRSSAAKSKTIQASAGQIATGASGVAGAVGYLEGTAQIIAIVGGVLVVLLGMWIMRERLRAWADGWR
jgi:zinc D-Ala-D-Ala carboxypeptidase